MTENFLNICNVPLAELLAMYWDAKTTLDLDDLWAGSYLLQDEHDQLLTQIRHCSIEMLHRVDQGRMPVDALPLDVLRTWYTIYRQPAPENYREPCECACGFQESFGWIPEEGCLVHDPGDEFEDYANFGEIPELLEAE